jgi:protein-tyrosine phosphatase
MDEPWAKEACRKALELVSDERNLPLLFHCSSGQDRTGTLAFLINGLLGVSSEDLVRDWEASALWKDEHDWFNRNNTYAALLAVMDRYPGETLNDRIESYVKSTGFTDADIARLRALLLEQD